MFIDRAELYVKGGCTRSAEVPIQFAARAAGASKLNMAEQWRYLRHLAGLYRFRYPVLAPLVLFLFLVGAGVAMLTIVREVVLRLS